MPADNQDQLIGPSPREPVVIEAMPAPAFHATRAQRIALIVSLLQGGFGLGIPGLAVVLTWCVALTTLASGAAYVWNTARGE